MNLRLAILTWSVENNNGRKKPPFDKQNKKISLKINNCRNCDHPLALAKRRGKKKKKRTTLLAHMILLSVRIIIAQYTFSNGHYKNTMCAKRLWLKMNGHMQQNNKIIFPLNFVLFFFFFLSFKATRQEEKTWAIMLYGQS